MFDGECLVQSTIPELNHFFRDSTVWEDIVGHLHEALEMGQRELEDPVLTEAETAYRRGKISQLRLLLELPDIMVSVRETQEEETKVEIEEVEDNASAE